jgi:topoisomerase-4 subunit A
MVREIEADAKLFADERRTLIQTEKKAIAEVKVIDEPVTVVMSQGGWVRARSGHGHDAASFGFKAGDGLYSTFECRTVDTLLAFGSNGRVYSVPVAALPGARGDGQPITTLIELEPATRLVHFYAGPPAAWLLLSTSTAYGFLATVDNMSSRQKAGKSFINCNEGDSLCRPSAANVPPEAPATHVVCVSAMGRLLSFPIAELKAMFGGGRGLQLMELDARDSLAGAAAYTRSVKIEGQGRGDKPREEILDAQVLKAVKGSRGSKGKVNDLGFKPSAVSRVE